MKTLKMMVAPCFFLLSQASLAGVSESIQQCIDENYEYVKGVVSGLGDEDAASLLNVAQNADCALVVLEGENVWCRPYLLSGDENASCDNARELKQLYGGKFSYEVYVKNSDQIWVSDDGSSSSTGDGGASGDGSNNSDDFIFIVDEGSKG